MNDNDLRQLFDDYRPTPGGDVEFMEELQRRLDAVECIHSMQKAQRRRSMVALVLAAAAGCVAGSIAALVSPRLANLFILNASDMAANTMTFVSWICAGAVSLVVTLAAYDLCRMFVAGKLKRMVGGVI